MNTRQIAVQIQSYVIKHSNYDTSRNYLGMFKVGDCPRKAYREFKDGFLPSEEAYRMSFAGYEHERAILVMLQETGIASRVERELVAPFDDRFRGHIDAETSEGFLCEIKTLSTVKFEKLKLTERMNIRHFAQAQLYMRYGGYDRALILYRCRENYETLLFDLAYNPSKAEQFEQKAKRILRAIDSGEPPACECGFCK